MINLFVLQKGRLAQEQVDDRQELLKHHNPIKKFCKITETRETLLKN